MFSSRGGSRDNCKGMGSLNCNLKVSHIIREAMVPIAFSPDSQYLAAAGWDSTLRVWRLTSGLEVSHMTHEDVIGAIAFSSSGRYLATATEDSIAQVWEVSTGRQIACMFHDDSVTDVAVSPNEEYLVTLTGSKLFPPPVRTVCHVTIWEIHTSRKVLEVTHDYGVNAFALSPSGKYLAIASSDSVVGMWEGIISQKTIGFVLKYLKFFRNVALQVNGREDLVTVSCHQLTQMWKASTSLAVNYMTHKQMVTALVFSPSERYIATASLDCTAQVWAVTSTKEIAQITHEQEINAIAFSPDEKHLATASDDLTARVWNLSNSQEVARINLKNKVNAIAFSPDGRFIATASGDLMSSIRRDCSVKLWFWNPENLM